MHTWIKATIISGMIALSSTTYADHMENLYTVHDPVWEKISREDKYALGRKWEQECKVAWVKSWSKACTAHEEFMGWHLAYMDYLDGTTQKLEIMAKLYENFAITESLGRGAIDSQRRLLERNQRSND